MGNATTIRVDDLRSETAELLPSRETLDFFGPISINVSPVTAVNLAIAVNAATINSNVWAYAGQWLSVLVTR